MSGGTSCHCADRMPHTLGSRGCIYPKPADLPALPYAGTSGHSGSSTSRERAEHEDSSGVTGKRQGRVLEHVDYLGTEGATVREIRIGLSLHHGQASAALSNLHSAGHLVRLTERRERCQVYVTPDNVNGREVVPHRSQVGSGKAVLTDQEQRHVDDARQVVTLHKAGTDSMQHNLVPTWRVDALLQIIDRLTDG